MKEMTFVAQHPTRGDMHDDDSHELGFPNRWGLNGGIDCFVEDSLKFGVARELSPDLSMFLLDGDETVQSAVS